jgi:hypothetical protein
MAPKVRWLAFALLLAALYYPIVVFLLDLRGRNSELDCHKSMLLPPLPPPPLCRRGSLCRRFLW